jgi:type IV secretory pathway VirD2 relaxase
VRSEEEREFRLRPRKPQVPKTRDKNATWAKLFRGVMRYARMSRKARRSPKRTAWPNQGSRLHSQHCAVRAIYSRNAVRGQWGAHGRYLARESARHEFDSKEVGFDRERESIDIATRLDIWQRAGDELMWKFIISPEFGDRVDLKRLTHELMARIEQDLGRSRLEWIAVEHYNTEHPHIHVALRGVDGQGQRIRLDREYVKRGIRTIAEDLCTRQLGYRTEFDASAAQRREVGQHRYTSLDRIISQSVGLNAEGETDARFFRYIQEPRKSGIRDGLMLCQQHAERLVTLQTMGLAERIGSDAWLVRRDFESVLRAMQRIGDRQKTLASHGIPMSDERLSVTTLDSRNLTSIEGRVLVHGEEEAGREAGRPYLMLEGTDAHVHHIYYTSEMEDARNRGDLRTNSFVRLRKLFANGEPRLEVDDFGDAEAVLNNNAHMRQTVRNLIKRGVIPDEDGWGGWLGRYQAGLKKMALEELDRDQQRKSERYRDRGRD